jgi:hypothetical protein
LNVKVVSLSAVAVAALTAPAFAHHSFAMFDAEQILQGTAKISKSGRLPLPVPSSVF